MRRAWCSQTADGAVPVFLVRTTSQRAQRRVLKKLRICPAESLLPQQPLPPASQARLPVLINAARMADRILHNVQRMTCADRGFRYIQRCRGLMPSIPNGVFISPPLAVTAENNHIASIKPGMTACFVAVTNWSSAQESDKDHQQSLPD